MTDWIPAPDAEALGFMQTFAATTAANQAVYFLQGSDVASIQAAVQAFAAAQAVAIDPDSSTRTTRLSRDQARAAAEALIRQYGALIRVNAGISDIAKEAIGVRPPNPSRESVEVPSTSPVLTVIASTMGVQTVRFADSMSPTRRAKPFGADMLQLFVAVGTANAENPEQATFHGAYSRNPIAVVFDFADRGKQATYFARWANVRNQVGPWSAPASLSIAA